MHVCMYVWAWFYECASVCLYWRAIKPLWRGHWRAGAGRECRGSEGRQGREGRKGGEVSVWIFHKKVGNILYIIRRKKRRRQKSFDCSDVWISLGLRTTVRGHVQTNGTDKIVYAHGREWLFMQSWPTNHSLLFRSMIDSSTWRKGGGGGGEGWCAGKG